jgi:hypothetical protein
MFLSFRMALSLAKSPSAAAFFGKSLIKANQNDLHRALRIIELPPQPSMLQPAAEIMLESVPSASHIIVSLPFTVVPHAQLAATSSSSLDASSPERKYWPYP